MNYVLSAGVLQNDGNGSELSRLMIEMSTMKKTHIHINTVTLHSLIQKHLFI